MLISKAKAEDYELSIINWELGTPDVLISKAKAEAKEFLEL